MEKSCVLLLGRREAISAHNFTRPCVIPLNSDGTETDVTLNLLEADDVKITAAITPQAATGQLIIEPEFKRAG